MLRRFYVSELSVGKVVLSDFESHHAINVLRVKEGELLELFDGQGKYAKARVIGTKKTGVEVLVEEINQEQQRDVKVTLGLAIPKYAKQEILVTMCTELGIWRFVPIIFSRSTVREKFRPEKWHRWAIQACKQSKRNFLPVISEPVRFDDFMECLICYDLIIYGESSEQCNRPEIVSQLKNNSEIIILVGPEGGFTDDEEKKIHSCGALGLKIGKNILRIETACVALSTLCIALKDL